MKIGLIGYGKMGRLIEEQIKMTDHQIVGKGRLPEIPREADVYIDFSHPESVLSNVLEVCKRGKPLVMGTSGWYGSLLEVKKLVLSHQIGFIYGHNFSKGVNLFLEIIKQASLLFNLHEEFDASALEIHHNQKVDSPSGTAVAISEILLKNLKQKTSVEYDRCQNRIAKNVLHFASLRNGHNPGMHEVIFDSPSETITLNLQTRNRTSYAAGALEAAEWILKKQGFYQYNEVFHES